METENTKSIFETLSDKDLTTFHKKKQNITYLPWSAAWAEVKRTYPKATFETLKDENHNLYHTDGKTCWVEVAVQIEDERQTETLAVMDHRNQAVPVENVTMTQVNNSIKRCLVKCLGLFGLDLNLWEGEELSVTAKQTKAKEAEENAKTEQVKKKILAQCTKMIKEGKSKDEIYSLIEDLTGNMNPNAIADKETADTVLEALQNMEDEQEKS